MAMLIDEQQGAADDLPAQQLAASQGFRSGPAGAGAASGSRSQQQLQQPTTAHQKLPKQRASTAGAAAAAAGGGGGGSSRPPKPKRAKVSAAQASAGEMQLFLLRHSLMDRERLQRAEQVCTKGQLEQMAACGAVVSVCACSCFLKGGGRGAGCTAAQCLLSTPRAAARSTSIPCVCVCVAPLTPGLPLLLHAPHRAWRSCRRA
jgi:hypothetical protein